METIMFRNIIKNSSFINKIKDLLIPKPQVLGRWKLKSDREIFYNPDPGYPNNYLKDK